MVRKNRKGRRETKQRNGSRQKKTNPLKVCEFEEQEIQFFDVRGSIKRVGEYLRFLGSEYKLMVAGFYKLSLESVFHVIVANLDQNQDVTQVDLQDKFLSRYIYVSFLAQMTGVSTGVFVGVVNIDKSASKIRSLFELFLKQTIRRKQIGFNQSLLAPDTEAIHLAWTKGGLIQSIPSQHSGLVKYSANDIFLATVGVGTSGISIVSAGSLIDFLSLENLLIYTEIQTEGENMAIKVVDAGKDSVLIGLTAGSDICFRYIPRTGRFTKFSLSGIKGSSGGMSREELEDAYRIAQELDKLRRDQGVLEYQPMIERPMIEMPEYRENMYPEDPDRR